MAGAAQTILEALGNIWVWVFKIKLVSLASIYNSSISHNMWNIWDIYLSFKMINLHKKYQSIEIVFCKLKTCGINTYKYTRKWEVRPLKIKGCLGHTWCKG